MVSKKRCPLFRKAESLSLGKGLGYCDIDSSTIVCEGDVSFCEKPDDLKKYLRARLKELEKKDK